MRSVPPARIADRIRRVRRAGAPRHRPGGRWVPYALVVLAAAASLAGLAIRPTPSITTAPVDYVIIAGAPGLRWDDLDPQRTPNLWREASAGSIGWLSVRSANRTTCPGDGWLTLGAGNYAAYRSDKVTDSCPRLAPELTQPDGIGANLTRQPLFVRENQD